MGNICTTFIDIESDIITEEKYEQIIKNGFLVDEKHYPCPFIEDEEVEFGCRSAGGTPTLLCFGYTDHNLDVFGKQNGGEYGDYQISLHKHLTTIDPDVVTIIKQEEDCEDFVSVEVLYKNRLNHVYLRIIQSKFARFIRYCFDRRFNRFDRRFFRLKLFLR